MSLEAVKGMINVEVRQKNSPSSITPIKLSEVLDELAEFAATLIEPPTFSALTNVAWNIDEAPLKEINLVSNLDITTQGTAGKARGTLVVKNEEGYVLTIDGIEMRPYWPGTQAINVYILPQRKYYSFDGGGMATDEINAERIPKPSGVLFRAVSPNEIIFIRDSTATPDAYDIEIQYGTTQGMFIGTVVHPVEGSKYTHSIPALQENTTYYIRARYRGAGKAPSEWVSGSAKTVTGVKILDTTFANPAGVAIHDWTVETNGNGSIVYDALNSEYGRMSIATGGAGYARLSKSLTGFVPGQNLSIALIDIQPIFTTGIGRVRNESDNFNPYLMVSPAYVNNTVDTTLWTNGLMIIETPPNPQVGGLRIGRIVITRL